MFTKDNLLSMKYKELVVIAKKHGVYKARCKKVWLCEQLLPLLENERIGCLDPTVKEEKSVKNLTPSFLRQRTFSIDKQKEESLSLEKTVRTSFQRQGTFTLDKSKEDNPSDKTGRTSFLRQSTFSIDKPGTIQEAVEMPALICQDIKNSPKIKPYIINETPNSLVQFRSPIKTKNSILPASARGVKSIGQRIEYKRNAVSEMRPATRGSKLHKIYSMDTASVTPVRVHKTSMKGGRIEKKITPSKLPNFKAIHMREFSKMESIVEHIHRKAERTKSLTMNVKLNQLPVKKIKENSLVTSRIPVKSELKVTENTPASITPIKSQTQTPNRVRNVLSNKKDQNKKILDLPGKKSQVSNIQVKLKQMDSPMTKVKRKSEPVDKMVSNSKKRVENMKELVVKKSRPYSIERNRAKGREFLQSVRMNRRFQLQMEVMRKAKV